MEKLEVERVWEDLKSLKRINYSAMTLGKGSETPFIIEGNFHEVRLLGTKGSILIKGFVNFLDARGICDCYLELNGKFNVVDISNGQRVKLNYKNAQINFIISDNCSFQLF